MRIPVPLPVLAQAKAGVALSFAGDVPITAVYPFGTVTVTPLLMTAVSPEPGMPAPPHVAALFQLPVTDAV